MPVFTVFLLLIPLIELWLLIEIGSALGALPTFLLLVAAGVLGVSLLRRASISTLLKAQHSMRQGQQPAGALLEGAATVLGGVLFLIPGFFTDVLGALLVFPLTRYWLVRTFLKRGMVVSVGRFHAQTYSTQRSNDIEGEVVQRHEHSEKISSDRP